MNSSPRPGGVFALVSRARVSFCCAALAFTAFSIGNCGEEPAAQTTTKLTPEELQLAGRAIREFLQTHRDWVNMNYRTPPPGDESLAGPVGVRTPRSGYIGTWVIALVPGGASASTQHGSGDTLSVLLHLTLRRGERGYEVVDQQVERFHNWD